MKNIQNVVIMTDSSNNNAGFLKIIFDDNSQEQCSSEMKPELWNKASEWMKTHNADYDLENLLQRTYQDILNQINLLYKEAQIIKIINGITFYYPINGESYSIFKDKVQEALILNFCKINIKDINEIFYSAEIPHNLILMIYQEMDKISSENDKIKISLESKLMKLLNDKDINSMKNLDLTIFKTDSEINLNKICDLILKNFPEDDYLNKIKFNLGNEIRYHIFTKL